MFALLHGYHLGGSGSNYWTRYMSRALCQLGESFVLGCLEDHPEDFDFISEALDLSPSGVFQPRFNRKTPFPGRCRFFRLPVGKILPVYVSDYVKPRSSIVPMVKMSNEQIETYLRDQERAIMKAVHHFGINALHANHTVLLSVVAQRLHQKLNLPFSVMPHGSALEYVVKKDPRFFTWAEGALKNAEKIFCLGNEMENNLKRTFTGIPKLEERFKRITLGVDTQTFHEIPPGTRESRIHQLIAEIENFGKDQTPTRRPSPQAVPALRQIDWKREKIILHVGAILPKKGLEVLLEAMPAILKKVPEAKLLIVGSGPMLEPWKEKFRTLEDRIVFLGYFPHRLLSLLFPCADAAAFPSLIPEAGPLVFLESLASGTLPLGTNQGGMKDFFKVMEPSFAQKDLEKMQLHPELEKMKRDLIEGVPWALQKGPDFSPILRKVAVECFDWKVPAQIFRNTLHLLGGGNPQNFQAQSENGLQAKD
jgi:glycosyltransferase involved in cell wall biosynthesis